MLTHISNMTELSDLMAKDPRAIVMDFYAEWCGPCKAIAPLFERFADSDVSQSVCFVKVDVDVAEDVASHYQVSAMPTFLSIKDGKEVSRVTGANRTELSKLITEAACHSQP